MLKKSFKARPNRKSNILEINVDDENEILVTFNWPEEESIEKTAELLTLIASGILMNTIVEQIGVARNSPDELEKILQLVQSYMQDKDGEEEPLVQPINALQQLISYGQERNEMP